MRKMETKETFLQKKFPYGKSLYICPRIMEKQEKEIFDGAMQMFMKYGIRSVTMDDVARELGISKKTVYKYVDNKAALVQKTVDHIFSIIHERFEKVYRMQGNAIDLLFAVDDVMCEHLEDHDPGMQFQLQKYYPEVYRAIHERKKEAVLQKMTFNIEKGKKEGLYREEVHTEIISYLYYSRMMVLENEINFPMSKFTQTDVMRELLIYHIRGIATPKGTEYLEKTLELNQKV